VKSTSDCKTQSKLFAGITKQYSKNAKAINTIGCIGIELDKWRFNLRSSNTEPVVRLNVGSKADAGLMRSKTEELLGLIVKLGAVL